MSSMKFQVGVLLLAVLIQKTHSSYSDGFNGPTLNINAHPSTSASDISLNPDPNLNPSMKRHHLPQGALGYSPHVPSRKPPRHPRHAAGQTSPTVLVDNYLGPEECVGRNYTHLSCEKAFCPPWTRCVNGTCVCKMAFECPRRSSGKACGLDGWTYGSYCEALAASCTIGRAMFSHYGDTCSIGNVFSSSLRTDKQVVEVWLPNISRYVLVCARDWDMAAGHVMCRHKTGRGAKTVASVSFSEVQRKDAGLPDVCVRMQCTGHEYSLAECDIYGHMRPLTPTDLVASVHCATDDTDSSCEFKCTNGRCVKLDDTCDGVNHCGDGSDEMCCKACRRHGSHCQSNVCIPSHAVGDGIRDCLGGDDELITINLPTEPVISAPKEEIKTLRDSLEALKCGIPNVSANDGRTRRRKRIVGGVPTMPTQIQWQVAIQENGKIQCGGAYLGGCWVLTAAHCVSAYKDRPGEYVIKFSLWEKRYRIDTTDLSWVKKVHIHYGYDSTTYKNDIALLELKHLGGTDKCVRDNPAIRSVCVPWSVQQFPPKHNCTISGWGRDRAGRYQNKLMWARVALIDNCKSYYQTRYHEGMMCAGDLEGSVDACQGDSGGPLVCEDASECRTCGA